MNGGDKKGFFSDLNGVVKNYWPGGNGVAGMCGCGLTKTCAEPDKNVRLLKSQKICLEGFFEIVFDHSNEIFN